MQTAKQVVIKPSHDGELNMATALRNNQKKWHNAPMKWSDLLKKLTKPTVTPESLPQYMKMTRTRQGEIKDVGGFVGGYLKGGRRTIETVQSRSIICLDIDYGTPNSWEDIKMMFDSAVAMYTTHKYTKAKPRMRILIPLKHPVQPDQYQAIARKLADLFGIEQFDDSTYAAERLMYWPSISKGADYIFDYVDAAWLDPEEVLNEYLDWTDSSTWPISSRVSEIHVKEAKKAGDPLTKKGVVGAFNRTYSIEAAIEKFLSDVYAPTAHEDRYTYVNGSTQGGLVLYDDVFAYSHHGTDPVGETLNNAFDLVRKHLFIDQDDTPDVKENTPVNRLPSFKAMREFALEDEDVRLLLTKEQVSSAQDDFAEPLVDEDDQEVGKWMKALTLDDATGEIESSAGNLEVIMRNDPNLKDKFYTDKFANRLTIKGKVPWRRNGEAGQREPYWKDSDDAGLRVYLEKAYKIVNRGKVEDAFVQEAERNAVHPVREYLATLAWDGKPRLETLLVDYLGAENTPYTRVVTRKFLIAAIARIMHPGCKFDYMLVTTGPQGIGKTMLPQVLAGKWFSNSLESMQGKDAYEALQGSWIQEIGEMTATKKADIEATKHFISKTEDVFRQAYGRHNSYFPRQCVFWGTSNDSEFLRDRTGNRRFWPVDVGLEKHELTVWDDLTEEVRGQIWAEAKERYEKGESYYLTSEEETLAKEQQAQHTETSSLDGVIREYLDTPVTEDWEEKSAEERRRYYENIKSDDLIKPGNVRREKVCVLEVWNEVLKGDTRNLVPVKAYEIRNILGNLPGWHKAKTNRGQLRFGSIYGRQVAYLRDNV